MEAITQSSDGSDSDGDNGWPATQITRRRHIQQQSTKQEHSKSLKGSLN